ncbi:MAG TPA: sugar porter family MFS transporter [Terracidiphilus sp.]
MKAGDVLQDDAARKHARKLLTKYPHTGRGRLTIAAMVAALGGFLFGYDNIVISGAIQYLILRFHLDATGTGWAAGCALVGCIAGSALAGSAADFMGHRKSLAGCALCFALSSVGLWFSGDLTNFVAWRLIAGFAIGAASIICPMYIAEVAPTRLRGRLVTLYQLGIVLGILAAVFSNMCIQRMGNEAWNETTGWRWMFLVGVVPAVIFGMLIIASVESPRWLLKMGRTRPALEVLNSLGEDATSQMRQIEQALKEEQGRFSELFTVYRRPLLLGIMLAAFQQISGVTPIFAFLPVIFSIAGTATRDAFSQSVLVSLINLVFTLFALWLVDTAGRKTLILVGTSVQLIALAWIGWIYCAHGPSIAIVIAIMGFVAGHAFGNGVACWVIISEIYPTKVRGRAMSIATTTLWLIGYLGNQFFPIMMARLGAAATFWTFGGGALLTIVCVYLLVPETRGKSLEEITLFWSSHEAGVRR